MVTCQLLNQYGLFVEGITRTTIIKEVTTMCTNIPIFEIKLNKMAFFQHIKYASTEDVCIQRLT